MVKWRLHAGMTINEPSHVFSLDSLPFSSWFTKMCRPSNQILPSVCWSQFSRHNIFQNLIGLLPISLCIYHFLVVRFSLMEPICNLINKEIYPTWICWIYPLVYFHKNCIFRDAHCCSFSIDTNDICEKGPYLPRAYRLGESNIREKLKIGSFELPMALNSPQKPWK